MSADSELAHVAAAMLLLVAEDTDPTVYGEKGADEKFAPLFVMECICQRFYTIL